MKFNQTDFSDLKWERDRKMFIESFPGEKTFLSLPDNKAKKSKVRLLRTVSISKYQYPIDYDIDPTIPIIPVNIVRGLEKLNDYGAGIFVCINETDGRGRKEDNVIKIRSCYADFDNPDKELPIFNIEPSLIVETSPKKYHVYWFSDNIPVECFRGLQESIIYRLDSDVAVKDPSRTMRVPGFYHNKGKRYMTNIVHYTGVKYDFNLLSETFPPKPREQFSAPKFKKDLYGDKKEFTGQRGATDGGRNHHIIKCIGGAIKRGLSLSEVESEIYKEAESCNPPLNQFDINNLLKSARKYF